MLLLRAATRRDPGERACAALLKALEARPDAAVSGPEVELDLSLAEAYVARGMFLEARAVLIGAGLDRVSPGADHARVLDELLAPLPADAEPELLQAFRHLMTGGASLSLSLVEEHVQRGQALPPWAARRRTVLRALLLDHVLESAGQAATTPGSQAAPVLHGASGEPSALARETARLVAERDLRGAVAQLRAHCASAPDDVSAAIGAEALERLLHVLETRDGLPDVTDTRTLPMGPQKVAELHLRMGNLAESERLYRRVVLDQPENLELRAMLDDVQAVARFLASPSAPVVPRAPAAQSRPVDAAATEIGIRPTVPLAVVDYDDGESTEEDGPEELARLYTDITGARAADPRDAATDELPTRPADVTRRVSPSDLARVPTGAPSTAPVLSKKSAGPSGGFAATTGYAAAKGGASSAPSWDDDETNTLEPAVEAELLLKQGFAIRALELYRILAEGKPVGDPLGRRVAEIEALILAERLPMPDDVTVQRDVSDLQRTARPTASRLSVPENVRAAAAAVSTAALPGTLYAHDLPQGQFDDDAPTSIAVGRGRALAPAPSAPAPSAAAPLAGRPTTVTDSVSVTRIVVVR